MKFTKKQKKEIVRQFFGAESSPCICKKCGYFGGRIELAVENELCPKCGTNNMDAAASHLEVSMKELDELIHSIC